MTHGATLAIVKFHPASRAIRGEATSKCRFGCQSPGGSRGREARFQPPRPTPLSPHLPHGFLGFRVTNPSAAVNYLIVPPFLHVLVQSNQPVPGETYNVLQIAVRNGTSQTFTASNNFTVRMNTDKKQVFPVLTGTEVWKPKQIIIFYILTKKYYPLPQTYGGFQLDLGGRSSTLVPGPSAIFLRLKYNPATSTARLTLSSPAVKATRGARAAFSGFPIRRSTISSPGEPTANDYGGHF